MKKEQVQIGGIYAAKVSGRSVPVRIEREHPRGGWDATSLVSNKKIRVKTAQRLSVARGGERVVVDEDTHEPEADVPEIEAAQTGVPETAEPTPSPQAPTGPVATAGETLDPGIVAHPAAPERAGKAVRRGGAKAALTIKSPATPKAPAADKPAKAMGCLDAAAEVLKAAGGPMRCKQMITAMAVQGLWSSTAATPEATLYSAILREVTTKGEASRFKKTERGHFAMKE